MSLKEGLARYTFAFVFSWLVEWSVASEPNTALQFSTMLATILFLDVYLTQGKREKQRQQGAKNDGNTRGRRT